MRQKSAPAKEPAEQVIKTIRRATRRQFSAEEKIRIVLDGLRGEDSIAELCRKEGIAQNLYYRWSKDFLEAGKKRLAGDMAREATSDEVQSLRAEGPASGVSGRSGHRNGGRHPSGHRDGKQGSCCQRWPVPGAAGRRPDCGARVRARGSPPSRCRHGADHCAPARTACTDRS